MTDQMLGVTTCPTCQKRFRILKKHESFIGKSISCPKCNRPFVISLETPAPIEQAAMANGGAVARNGESVATSAVVAQSKRRKRTKAEIRKAAYARIRKEFRPFMKRLEAISACDSYSEEMIRVWCIELLKTALGYKDEDLDLELTAINKRIDIAVKHDSNVIMIIECKKKSSLQENARKQAVNYAMNRSADWAVVTNGQAWELHRVIPVAGQNPTVVEVFNISLFDDDGLSTYDIERMYLLTKRALLRGETEKEFHRAQCLDDKRLFDAMFSERAIKAIRRSLLDSYKKEFKEQVKLTADEVYEELKQLIRPGEL